MSIDKWQRNAQLDDWFYNHSESERAEFERKMGIKWEEGTPEQKYGAVRAWIGISDNEEAEATIERRLREQHERAKELEEMRQGFLEELTGKIMYAKAELERRKAEAYAKVEEMKCDRLQQMLTQLSRYVVGGVREALESLPKQFLETGIKFVEELKERKLLPAPPKPNDIVNIGHASHCLLSRGPDNVVYTYTKADGHMYRRCIIAHASHDRSVLGLQFINSPLLDQGGCPLYRSRTLGAQLLGWVVPTIRHEKCDLANGLEDRIG